MKTPWNDYICPSGEESDFADLENHLKTIYGCIQSLRFVEESMGNDIGKLVMVSDCHDAISYVRVTIYVEVLRALKCLRSIYEATQSAAEQRNKEAAAREKVNY